jgi:UDP-N-acetylmuramate--alanine ligase
MQTDKLTHIYFLGIGGIGMSALARYFRAAGKIIAGYDKTASELTTQLSQEGIAVHYDDQLDAIPTDFKSEINRENTLVVWTPAIPSDHTELNWFREQGYLLMKRAQVLGLITANSRTIAIAGTHGKTTTTTLIAHLLRTAGIDCSAFLGGISGNYHTNLLLGKKLNEAGKDHLVVVEADEYDRSFLWLHPALAIVTSVDADHLDIYGDSNEMYESYKLFISQVKEKWILKKPVVDTLNLPSNEKLFSYSLDSKDTNGYAENIRIDSGYYLFDLVYGSERITNLKMGLPGRHNVENAVAAASVAKYLGADDHSIRKALESFKGVGRRFEYRIRSKKLVYIDDYGHHPEELRACISSAKELYPDKKITGIFQPHLFSRTKDFANEFARSLELLDEVVLMEIYPAREKPIEGVNSSWLASLVKGRSVFIYSKEELVSNISRHSFDVLLTMGAGDIDRQVQPLENRLREQYKIEEGLA